VDRSLYALVKIECVVLPSTIDQITGTWTKKSEERFGHETFCIYVEEMTYLAQDESGNIGLRKDFAIVSVTCWTHPM
jgi:hypothetical protein